MGTVCQDSIMSGEPHSLKAFYQVIDTAEGGGGTPSFLSFPSSKNFHHFDGQYKGKGKQKEDKSNFIFFERVPVYDLVIFLWVTFLLLFLW